MAHVVAYPESYLKYLDRQRLALVTSHAHTSAEPWQQLALDALASDKRVFVSVPRRHGKTFLAAKIANTRFDLLEGLPIVFDDAHGWWEGESEEQKLENITKIMSAPTGSVLVMQTPWSGDSITSKIEEEARSRGFTILKWTRNGGLSEATRKARKAPVRVPSMGASRLVRDSDDRMTVRMAMTEDVPHTKITEARVITVEKSPTPERKRRAEDTGTAPPAKRKKKKRRSVEAKEKPATEPDAPPVPAEVVEPSAPVVEVIPDAVVTDTVAVAEAPVATATAAVADSSSDDDDSDE